MTATGKRVRHAFYLRPSGKRRWEVVGVFDTAEACWHAALNDPRRGDVWVSTLEEDADPDRQPASER